MYINGIGILLPGIETIGGLDKFLIGDKRLEGWKVQEPINISHKLKNRRVDKFSRMALYCCQNALSIKDKTLSPYDIGTVFNSIYGPEESVIAFYKEIVEKEYEYCSPIVFSNTVFNSALGNVCLNYELKGYSDALMCGRYIEHARRLLSLDKIKGCLVCGLENICEEKRNILKDEGKNVKEGAAALYLEKVKTKHTLARVVDCKSIYIETVVDNKKVILDTIYAFLNRNCVSESEIDYIICPNLYVEMLSKAIENSNIIDIDEKFGDMLGASLAVNIMVALRMLKINNKSWAIGIGYDHTGNLTFYVLLNEVCK